MLQRKKLQQKQELTNYGGTLIFLEDATINFGKIAALKSVQLNVDQGEILFVTGASGAGKTTLLRVLSGELSSESGRMITPRAFTTSQVFQDLRLIGRLSCEDNLMVSFDPCKYQNKSLFKSDMMELARILGIQDRLDMKIKDANGGLKQKVAIIRALLAKPDLFIADEPTSSLDVHNAKKLFELLNVYAVKKGMTVVWASHNSELVRKFSGRIVHLDKGRLVYSGHACFI